MYEQPAFPEVEYLFKHALTQEVAYHSLLQETRKVIHGRTAQAIEVAYQTELEDHYGDLAHHYSRSGNADKRIEYSEKASTQASFRAANADAVRHFETALTFALEKAHAAAERNAEHWFDAELYRIAGDINATDGKPQTAEANFGRAIQIAIEQQAKTFELRATLSLAKLLHAQGRSAEAHQRLNNVYEWFTEGFEFPDLQEAKRLLSDLKV